MSSLAAVLGGIAIIAAPLANADSADDAYLQTLKDKGITWPGGADQTMVQIGHAVCTDWSKGMTFEQTLADAKSGMRQLADTSLAKRACTARNTPASSTEHRAPLEARRRRPTDARWRRHPR